MFTERAQQLLETACAAANQGQVCSNLTVLIGQDGGIHLFQDSDWPLESLLRERQAQAAYRITTNRGTIQVEGYQGRWSCLLGTKTAEPIHTARRHS